MIDAEDIFSSAGGGVDDGGASVLPRPGRGGECGEEQQGQQPLPRLEAGGGAGPHQADARLHTERGQETITMFLSSHL